MKTGEASKTHSQQKQTAESTSLLNQQEQSFFSQQSFESTPFFPGGATPGIQTKGLANAQPFFQPSRVSVLQRKCAGCEAEEAQGDALPPVQRMAAFESDREAPVQRQTVLQRMPAFESDAEAPAVQPKLLVQRQAESPEMEPEEVHTDESLQDKVISSGALGDDEADDNGGNGDGGVGFPVRSMYRPSTIPFAQMKLTIGRPNDSFEQEADAVADQVMAQPKRQEHLATDIQTKPLDKMISRLSSQPSTVIPFKRLSKRPQVQRQETPTENQTATASDDVASRLNSSRGGGSALDETTRGDMESSFEADFSNVRIHTGSEATQLSQDLGAKAFTHGSDIYFNEGQYNPGSSDGKHLLAHELTHTVQQGAAIQRQPKVFSEVHQPHVQASFFDDPFGSIASAASSAISAGADLVGLSIDDLREMLADFVDDNIPVYSMLSVVIKYDVLRGRTVERTRANILKGVFSLINPLGSILRKRLEERGIIDEAFEWIDGQLTSLGLTAGSIKAKFNQFIKGVDLVTTSPIADNVALFKRTFGAIFSSIATFIQRAGTKVYEMIKQAFLKLLGELAKKIGGYDLLADLLGQDPITGEARNASTADILRGILKLPVIQAIGGDKLLKKLEELKLIDKTAAWIDQQWALLKKGFSSLLSIADKFLSLFTLSVEVLTNPMKIVNGIKKDVVDFVSSVISFFKNLASEALEIIKEAMIWLVNKYVDQNSPAWDLAVFVLGKNPLTGEKVPRNYLKLIGAFLKLLPGGQALYQKFIQTGALQRTVGWIQNAIQKFIAILLGLKDAFVNMWKIVTIDDLFEPIGFFNRVVNLFKKPVLKLVAFVKNVLIKIFEVLMELMKLPKEVAKEIISNVVKAFNDIRKNPIKFLLNLLKAVKAGFSKFFDNIGSHLLKGVTGWLFGQLAKAGITIPKKLDLPSVLDLVFQVLGLTIDNLWARLAERIGQDKVDKIKGGIDKLVGIWNFVTDVVKNGISAIWKYIQTQISGLWDMILEKAKNWIITTIIQKVTTKLLTMLDPTGIMAVVNGFIAFYKAIESFIEKLNEMLQIAASFVKGVAEIARGTVGKAADYLENSLASALPVALSFLANQIGLGGIGDKIKEIIQSVREFINKGIDWLLDKAIKLLHKGKAIAGKVVAWWKAKREFKTPSGKSHSLKFNGRGKKAQLEARSNIVIIIPANRLELELTKKKNRGKTTPGQRGSLLSKARGLENLLNREEVVTADVENSLDEIVTVLKETGILDEDSLPPSKVTWRMKEGRASKVEAEPLTKHPGNTKGSNAQNSVLGNDWKFVSSHLFETKNTKNTGREIKDVQVVAAHLLHAGLHGPGNSSWNLAIASRDEINNPMTSYEDLASQKVTQGERLKYTSEAEYFSNAPSTDKTADDYVEKRLNFLVAKSITITAEKWDESKNKYESFLPSKTFSSNGLPSSNESPIKRLSKEIVLRALHSENALVKENGNLVIQEFDSVKYARLKSQSTIIDIIMSLISGKKYEVINTQKLREPYAVLINEGIVRKNHLGSYISCNEINCKV